MGRGESEGRAADDNNSLNGARLERIFGGGGGCGIGHGADAFSLCSAFKRLGRDEGAVRNKQDRGEDGRRRKG